MKPDNDSLYRVLDSVGEVFGTPAVDLQTGVANWIGTASQVRVLDTSLLFAAVVSFGWSAVSLSNACEWQRVMPRCVAHANIAHNAGNDAHVRRRLGVSTTAKLIVRAVYIGIVEEHARLVHTS